MSEMQAGEAEGKTEGKTENDEAASEQLVDLIRDHPWVSILGAAALGYAIARIVRGDR